MALVTKFYSILYPPPEIRIDTVSKIAKFESRYIFQTIICGIYLCLNFGGVRFINYVIETTSMKFVHDGKISESKKTPGSSWISNELDVHCVVFVDGKKNCWFNKLQFH